MALAERIDEILRGLPRDWERARVDLTVEEPEQTDRAALILAPASPGRSGSSFLLHVHDGTTGLAPTPELVRRVVSRLDEAGIRGRVRLAEHERPAVEPTSPPAERTTLAGSWDALIRRLPPDWSDLYAEVELDSSDYLDRGALLLAPVNPSRAGKRLAFRFRVARRFGYGASPEMTRRCFERLDAEAIRGAVRILYALSDTKPVSTQGPVWYVGGRTV
jgi:hypothetical protein